MHLKHATLTFLLHRSPTARVLLGMKKRGFGQGKWNGYGGKILFNENPVQAAIREVEEESGVQLEAKNLQKIGELTFLMPHHPMGTQLVHVFLSKEWKGEARESDEMTPHWFPVDQIPFSQMLPSDQHWLPAALNNKPVTATFLFGPDNATLTSLEIHHPATIEELQKPAAYFSASISGGRDHAHFYNHIVTTTKPFARVLTEHFADAGLLNGREKGKSDEFLYWRDVGWIEACDWFIADVSQPSLGVGYEIALAEQLRKKIVCLYYKHSPRPLSAMVAGNHRIKVVEYENEKDAIAKLTPILQGWENELQSK